MCAADDPSFRLVSVQVQLESRPDTVPAEDDSGPCETCTVVITPGVYLSNLSSSDLHATHSSSSAPAAPASLPSGQSQPLPWAWQKRGDSGPLIALGLSREDCARAATHPPDSTDAIAAAAPANMQLLGGTVAAAKQGAAPLRGDAAAPSLAESFVSFLESQAGTKRSTAAVFGRPAWPAAPQPGVINIMRHQGRRIPIVLQGSDGQVRQMHQRQPPFPSSAVFQPAYPSLVDDGDWMLCETRKGRFALLSSLLSNAYGMTCRRFLWLSAS